MGCCSSAKFSSSSFLYCKKLQHAIEIGNLKTLAMLNKLFPNDPGSPNLIDEPFIEVHDLNMSPLAYALWIGRVAVFKFLHKQMGASIEAMEGTFKSQGKSALEIICSNGSIEILQYYLDYFLNRPSVRDSSTSADFQTANLIETKPVHTYTPVQIACENGHVNIINYIFNQFKNEPAPYLLDVNYQDQGSGENCPLIACRKGDYKMVKFLFEVCQADFKVYNRRKESAIVIAAAASRRRPEHDFYNLFVYLVEVVQVDYRYMQEEVVLLLEDKNIIRFYESKLMSSDVI